MDLIAHADWSTNAAHRWMCVARRREGGFYEIETPEPVGELSSLLARLRRRLMNGGSVMVGFDFPIGLPASFAERADITSFPEALRQFGEGEWSEFFELAETKNEISVHRPFYPARPGGTRQQHLVDGLRVDDYRELLRRCERSTDDRGAAEALFWTLGGKQVGRAAIAGWKHVLQPALVDMADRVGLWPFDGRLKKLLAEREFVVVETYPAEACVHLGMKPPGRSWSKSSRQGRESQAPQLYEWAAVRAVRFTEELKAAIAGGFADGGSGDDRFDATVGLCSMLEVVLGHRSSGAPQDPRIVDVEGWILGANPSSRDAGVTS